MPQDGSNRTRNPTAKLSAEPKTTALITLAQKRALKAEATRQNRPYSAVLADLIDGIGEARAPRGASLTVDLVRCADLLSASNRRLELQGHRLEAIILAKIDGGLEEIARQINDIQSAKS